MNLVIIGNDVDDIALDIWKGNTNYTVLNKSPYLWGTNFINYIGNKDVIVTTDEEQFKAKTINQFLEYMTEHEFIPIFIADSGDDFVNLMYTAVNEIIQDAVLYTRNETNDGYDELIKLTRNYLIKRKNIDDKVVRASGEGETSTSKE